MLAPRQDPFSYQHQNKELEPAFSLLCWNIHKENLLPDFQLRLHTVLHTYPSDFLLLQEYKMPKSQPHDLRGLSYAMAANMETKKSIYGLLTASRFGFVAKQTALSHKKELMVSTRKSILITTHSFTDTRTLHIVNMHGINFVSSKTFENELNNLDALLQSYCGAMIVCGDFNNWNKRRIKALDTFMQRLSLEQAAVHNSHHVKHIFLKPIDHIYYRELRLLKAEAIDTKKISDHNPIHAVFEQL